MRHFFIFLGMLLAASTAGAFDFRVQAPTGQWVYYNIGSDGTTVSATNPDWDSHTQPTGVLQLPATVENEGHTYALTAIESDAFRSCESITAVIIPEGVQYIGRMAFAFCTALDSISLPTTLTYIGSMAFTSTSFFSNHVNANGLLISGVYLLNSRINITGNVTLPFNIQGLGNMAFYGCEHIERITLPAGLRFIGENAFQDCMALDTIEIRATTPPTLADNAFTNADNAVILVPYGCGNIYRAAENWSDRTIVEKQRCLPFDPNLPIIPHPPIHVGIDDIDPEPVPRVTATSGGLNIDSPRPCTVTDMLGRTVATTLRGDTFVALPCPGVYLVKPKDSKTIKVLYRN